MGILILRFRNFNRWLSFDDTKWHRWSVCQMKPFWMNFHVSKLRDPRWHPTEAMIKKPHFYYTRLEKIALTLTHKIPFLPILGHFLSHLTTTISNPRPFPISRCNNPKKLKKLSQGSGPQCTISFIHLRNTSTLADIFWLSAWILQNSLVQFPRT